MDMRERDGGDARERERWSVVIMRVEEERGEIRGSKYLVKAGIFCLIKSGVCNKIDTLIISTGHRFLIFLKMEIRQRLFYKPMVENILTSVKNLTMLKTILTAVASPTVVKWVMSLALFQVVLYALQISICSNNSRGEQKLYPGVPG